MTTKVKDQLKELRRLDKTGLNRRLSELRQNLRDLSFRTRSDEIRDMHLMRKTRKEIARILTLLEEGNQK